MEMNFKAKMVKGWTLKDEVILVGKKVIVLDDVKRADYREPDKLGGNGVITLTMTNGEMQILAFPKKDRQRGESALNYIRTFCEPMEEKRKKTVDERLTSIANGLEKTSKALDSVGKTCSSIAWSFLKPLIYIIVLFFVACLLIIL